MKPLLVGESNPYQADPRLAQRFALYPDPPHCAGWNLCHRVMQLTEREYLARFDRVNLCDGKWSMREARARATELAMPTTEEINAALRLGAINATELDRTLRGYDARERPPGLLDAIAAAKRRVLILFGAKVPTAFSLKFEPFTRPLEHIVILPHPSGLSRAWNEPGAHERARAVLREAGVL